jgi:hypothetical protein
MLSLKSPTQPNKGFAKKLTKNKQSGADKTAENSKVVAAAAALLKYFRIS